MKSLSWEPKEFGFPMTERNNIGRSILDRAFDTSDDLGRRD
jgi:hypothetical protein